MNRGDCGIVLIEYISMLLKDPQLESQTPMVVSPKHGILIHGIDKKPNSMAINFSSQVGKSTRPRIEETSMNKSYAGNGG